MLRFLIPAFLLLLAFSRGASAQCFEPPINCVQYDTTGGNYYLMNNTERLLDFIARNLSGGGGGGGGGGVAQESTLQDVLVDMDALTAGGTCANTLCDVVTSLGTVNSTLITKVADGSTLSDVTDSLKIMNKALEGIWANTMQLTEDGTCSYGFCDIHRVIDSTNHVWLRALWDELDYVQDSLGILIQLQGGGGGQTPTDSLLAIIENYTGALTNDGACPGTLCDVRAELQQINTGVTNVDAGLEAILMTTDATARNVGAVRDSLHVTNDILRDSIAPFVQLTAQRNANFSGMITTASGTTSGIGLGTDDLGYLIPTQRVSVAVVPTGATAYTVTVSQTFQGALTTVSAQIGQVTQATPQIVTVTGLNAASITIDVTGVVGGTVDVIYICSADD